MAKPTQQAPLSSGAAKKRVKKAKESQKVDASAFRHGGEADGPAGVYNIYDDVRRNIAAHHRDSSVMQAGFLTQAAKCSPDPVKFYGKQLIVFLKKAKALAGDTSRVSRKDSNEQIRIRVRIQRV